MYRAMEKCLEEIVDPKTGLIRKVTTRLLAPSEIKLFSAMVIPAYLSRYDERDDNNMPLPWPQQTSGVGLTKEAAIYSAVGEFIERYCACICDKDILIKATYNQMVKKDYNTVAPSAFALFSEEQYTNKSIPFKKFTEETVVRWVEAISLITHKPVWVPACFVWLVPFSEGIIFPNSNGLAAAPNRDDAILGALCEVVERDAIMITWFNRLPAPRIPIEETNRDLATLLVNRSVNSGLEYDFIDITTNIKIPTVFTISIDRNGGTGVLVGASCKVNIEDAILKSFFEGAFQARPTVEEIGRRRVSTTSKIPGKLSASRRILLTNHIAPYANIDAIQKFDFLLNAPLVSPSYSSIDKEASLAFAINKIKDAGLDALMIELTTPDISALGFHVIRVVIPGAIGINVGKEKRFLGGKRIYTVPQKLGYIERVVQENELNPLPHPFP
ncbi:MAG: YcaO-like family protein [Euryarchaeota archaeon]|nr:YcaO-like family protein [Euryarchaeota archaeon]